MEVLLTGILQCRFGEGCSGLTNAPRLYFQKYLRESQSQIILRSSIRVWLDWRVRGASITYSAYIERVPSQFHLLVCIVQEAKCSGTYNLYFPLTACHACSRCEELALIQCLYCRLMKPIWAISIIPGMPCRNCHIDIFCNRTEWRGSHRRREAVELHSASANKGVCGKVVC